MDEILKGIGFNDFTGHPEQFRISARRGDAAADVFGTFDHLIGLPYKIHPIKGVVRVAQHLHRFPVPLEPGLQGQLPVGKGQ